MLKQPVDQTLPPTPPPRPRFRLPLRSLVLLMLAAGMIAAAVLLVNQDNQQTDQGERSAAAPQADQSRQGSGQSGQAQEDGAGQPPAQATNGAFATTLQSGRLSLELVVVPANTQGPNQVHVTGLVPDGNLADIQNLQVTLQPPGGGTPVIPRMERLAGNHLLAPAVTLPAGGEWQLQLRFRIRETDLDRTRTLQPFREVELSTTLPVR